MKPEHALVAIAMAAIAQVASAATGSVTSVSVDVRLPNHSPIARSSTHTAAAGAANISGNEVKISSGDYIAKSSVQPGGGNAKLSIHLEMDDAPGALNLSDATAKVTVGDSILFSSADQSSRVLHLHKSIDLRSSGNGAFTPPFQEFTSERVFGRTEIAGDGIASGLIFREFNFFADSHGHTASGSLELPPEVNFDLDFTVGEVKEFDLSLSAFIQMINLNDSFGTPFNYHTLVMNFLSGGTLTDIATGKPACGISAASASGFNYLAGIDIGACQVDGGGGGGTSGVPEPASWALMLGGFGLVGGVLRSGRRTLAVTSNG